VAYLARMRRRSRMTLLVLCAAALGLEPGFFTRHTGHATPHDEHQQVPADDAGRRTGKRAVSGSARTPISARSPSLDREPGPRVGLQVWTEQDGWQDAPYVPGSFTINSGDPARPLERGQVGSPTGTGVLPPQAEAPDEDLVSLVYFYGGRPRRGDRVAAAADRQAQRLRAGRVGAVPQDAPGRDHDRLATGRPATNQDPMRGCHAGSVTRPGAP